MFYINVIDEFNEASSKSNYLDSQTVETNNEKSNFLKEYPAIKFGGFTIIIFLIIILVLKVMKKTV